MVTTYGRESLATNPTSPGHPLTSLAVLPMSCFLCYFHYVPGLVTQTMPVILYLDRSVLDGPSPDLKEAKHTSIIMLKFDIIASSLDGVSQIISSQLVSLFKA